jgi:hypothetical protein
VLLNEKSYKTMIVNDKLFYIHIPRTGGRFLYEMLLNQVKERPHHGQYYKGIAGPHLHHPLYNEYFDVKDLTHFTIVRNPFDRFKSALKGPLQYQSLDFIFKKGFYDGMKELRDSEMGYKNNWFRPQHEFVSKTTHVWRLEDGLGDNFIKWMLDKFNVKANNNIKIGEYSKDEYDKIKVPNSVNQYKPYVKKYYKKDFERFGY